MFPSYHTILFLILIVALSLPVISVSAVYVPSIALSDSIVGKMMFMSFPVATLAGLLLLTPYLYFSGPRRKIRKRHLEMMERRHPHVCNLVQRISNQMTVEPPTVLWSEKTDYQAQVFGNHREIYLEITDGLCKMLDVNRDFFDAVILHELSHLKNRDLVKHTLAEKLVQSYLIVLVFHAAFFVMILPFVSQTFLEFHSIWLTELYVVPTITIYLLNAQLLRVREFYADARVASVQGTIEKLIFTLQLFAVRHNWHEKIGGTPSAVERIKMLRDNTSLFTPKIEIGLTLGLLLAFFNNAVSLSMVSFDAQNITILLQIPLVTGFALFSMMFLPFFFLVAMQGLKLFLLLSKFLAGVALGFLGYQIYAVRAIADLVLVSAVNTVLIIGILACALVLAFVMTISLFAHPSLSKNTKFLIVELSLIVFLISAFMIPGPPFISTAVLGVVVLILLRKMTRCPACGVAWKEMSDLFKCHSCSYETNQLLFETIH